MRLPRAARSIALVLALAACEVQIGGPPPAPPPPPPPARVAAAPRPPAPPPRREPPRPAPPWHAAILPGRTPHPLPMPNAQSGRLDVAALRVKLRFPPRCGPVEVPPRSGHFVHVDCKPYGKPTRFVPFSRRKIALLRQGKLRLDAAVSGNLPDAVDHRGDGTEGPVKDQGEVGACTAFSLSTVMDNAIRRQGSSIVMSPMHVWAHYGVPDMQAAGDANVRKDIATFQQFPYDQRLACEVDTTHDCGPYTPPAGDPGRDAALQADIRQADGEGDWFVTEYDEIAVDPDTIAAILATGADVWFAMHVGQEIFRPNGDTVPDWNGGDIVGGHAVALAGYRHQNGHLQFLVHNSWGPGWGDGGYAYVSDAMIRSFGFEAFKVVVAGKTPPPRPKPPPPLPPMPAHGLQPAPQPSPPPPPQPACDLTDDDCGENDLVDSVTCQCAQMCPDDSRPANGQCR